MKERAALVRRFQEDETVPFFVLSLKAGGTGLNLTAASHVVHFDRWWNPAVENQATDRAFRIGQKKPVLVHKLVCRGTIEERIDAMLEDKQSALARAPRGRRTSSGSPSSTTASSSGSCRSTSEAPRSLRPEVQEARVALPTTDGDYPEYVSAAERRRRAARELARRSSGRGVAPRPVRIEGRDIATTFWGKAWCDHLESHADLATRLPRGRIYVRSGCGPRPPDRARRGPRPRLAAPSFTTSTSASRRSSPARWKAVRRACAGRIATVVELLVRQALLGR